MSTATTVYYSKKTGNRVGAKYGTRNPGLVESFMFVVGAVPVQFLDRGFSIPRTLAKARAADEARKAAAAQAEAEAAAKKAKKAAKKVPAKKTLKKVVKSANATLKKAGQPTVRVVKRDLVSGEFAAKKSRSRKVVSDVIKAPAKKRAVKPASQTGLVNTKKKK